MGTWGERGDPGASEVWTPGATGVAAATGLLPAGFWRRAPALLVDLAVVWLLLRIGDALVVPLARFDLAARAFRYAYLLVVPGAYFVLSHGTGGRTLGKRLLGARVVGADGEPIGYLQALGRLAAWLFCALLLGLGFLGVAFREDRRGLHDRLAGTRVVRLS
jgi:uncharacterized RDD family membrane protein YckC